MALDPRIILQGKTPDIGAAFNNALTNVQRGQQINQQFQNAPLQNQLLQAQTEQQIESGPLQNQLLEAQANTATAQVPTAQEEFNQAADNKFRSLVTLSQQILPDLESGNFEGVRNRLAKRSIALSEEGIDNTDTLEAIDILNKNPQDLIDASKAAVTQGINRGFLGNQKTNQIQTSEFVPGVGFAVVTKGGQARVVPVKGLGETEAEAREAKRLAKIGTSQKTSDIKVEETERKEKIKRRIARSSEIQAELSTRNRNAARSNRTISEALILSQKASQGLTGVAKLQLSRLIPGIDSSDESALDSALKQLALEQLQNFKGPTTDFEFGVTESIVGSIGNSKEANQARLKSLQRATWFNAREFKQFQAHTKKGGDPDTFSFNFGEPINTKKGVFTLQQLQDTAVQNNISIDDVLKRLN